MRAIITNTSEFSKKYLLIGYFLLCDLGIWFCIFPDISSRYLYPFLLRLWAKECWIIILSYQAWYTYRSVFVFMVFRRNVSDALINKANIDAPLDSPSCKINKITAALSTADLIYVHEVRASHLARLYQWWEVACVIHCLAFAQWGTEANFRQYQCSTGVMAAWRPQYTPQPVRIDKN